MYWKRVARRSVLYLIGITAIVGASLGIGWLIANVSWLFIIPPALFALVAMAMYREAK